MTPREPGKRVIRVQFPGYLTGFGLGAFLDGIVFHQLLRWHHLVSAYDPPTDLAALERNVMWDGVFHLTAEVIVTAGVVWLWASRRHVRDAGMRWLTGALLVGWGVFNLVDEIVFHLILGAHHIRMVDNYLVYDLVYTVVAASLVAGGLALQRRDSGAATAGYHDEPA